MPFDVFADKFIDIYKTQFIATIGGGVLGALVGRARTLGPRISELETTGTFSMVALGACSYALIANSIAPTLLPLVSGISMGVGFLAGALIFRDSSALEGTTSAALVWTVASAGLAIGCGLYELGLSTMVYLSLLIWLHEHDYPDFRLLGIMKRKRRNKQKTSEDS